MSGGPINLICPRCGEFVPNNQQPGAYPGALSRFDNATEICSPCGTDEAICQMAAVRSRMPTRQVVHPRLGTVAWVNPPEGA